MAQLLAKSTAVGTLPALFAPDAQAARRFVEFFAANIRNPNARRAYARAAAEFATSWKCQGLRELRDIESAHVAAYIEGLQERLAAPSVKVPGSLATPKVTCSAPHAGALANSRPSR